VDGFGWAEDINILVVVLSGLFNKHNIIILLETHNRLFPSATSREGPHPQALLRLSPDLHELHIGLLCRFTPRQLTDFLKASQDYRLEEAVQVTSLHYSIAVCLYLSGLQTRGGRPGNTPTL
jgi:hypothetical protein